MILRELKLDDDEELRGVKNEAEIEQYLQKKYNRVELVKVKESSPQKGALEEDISRMDRHFEASHLRDISMIQGGAPN